MAHTVLVIEDSKDVLDNMKEILELSNYTVHVAHNGKEGLEIAQQNIPDIILCDVMMPELDGYSVLRGLTNNPKTKNIPFVFVTAKSEKNDFRVGMDLGADDYLTKPFSVNDLLRMVSSRLIKAEVLNNLLKNDGKSLEEFFNNPDIPIENIYNLSDKISSKKIRRKEILFTEGDASKYLYFLVSGKIKTFRINEQGKEYITQVYKDKEFFGYSSLLDSNICQETAEALEDSEIACISKQDFHQLLMSNAELPTKFIKFITSDLSESNHKLLNLAYNSARKRVADAIIYLGNKYHLELKDGDKFTISRDDISSISAVSPESVSRNITDLRTEKLIEFENGQLKILNIKKLNSLKN